MQHAAGARNQGDLQGDRHRRHPGRSARQGRRDVLREISQHTDIKTRHVAELIVEWARAGHLASDTRHKLERSMATRTTLRPEPG
ncbi:hypothetical protein [Streptomyces lydicus]|uniref:hypothetical protein n=1 Tax=Streptomyces lydicus TaxID=47763 RepID=UPI00343F3364